MRTLKAVVVPVALGALGFALAWGGWHLVQDHQDFHAMKNYLVQQSQQPAPKGH